MRSIRVLSTLIACLFLSAPAFAEIASSPGPLFTAYNMWFGSLNQIHSINYQAGTLLPAGTEVKEFKVQEEKYESGVWTEPRVLFTTADGRRLELYYERKYFPHTKLQAFAERMFTRKNFAQMTEGLSGEEVGAIGRGAVTVGMSKPGVLISYGYPPEHRTPNLEADVWTYWPNRFKAKNICFDGEDKAAACEKRKKKDL